MLECLTKTAYGALGITQAVNTDVAVITDPGVGRWKIWGTGYHISQDGLKLFVAGALVSVIGMGAASTVNIGPFVVDIANPTDDINLKLNVGTGVGSASGTIYAQRMCDHLSEHAC